MRLNLSNIEEKDFTAIPAGKYVVKFTGFDLRETKDKPENKLPAGTPMINWETTVIRNADTGDDTHKNRKLWTNSIIHESTLFNLKGLLRACGWDDAALNSEELDFEPDEVLDHEVIAVVSVRKYNGDDTNDIKRFLPLSAAEKEKATSLLP